MLDNNGALQNVDTLDTVLTCSLRVYSFFYQLFGQLWLYVELYLEDSTFVLLYKLHIDYCKYLCTLLIYVVFSPEKIY